MLGSLLNTLIHLLERVTKSYHKVWQVLQSMAGITKCDRGITKWDKHYEMRSNIFFFSTRLRKHTRILIWSAYSLIQTINRNILIKWNPWSHFTGLYFPEFKLNMEIYPVHLHIHSDAEKYWSVNFKYGPFLRRDILHIAYFHKLKILRSKLIFTIYIWHQHNLLRDLN